MIAGSLARRYARALFDIGVSKGNFEELGREVETLAEALSTSRELVEALTNPVFQMQRRRAVLEAVLKAMKVSPVTHNFALMILERERVVYIPAIARELRAMVDAQAGRVRATVTSARGLTPDASAELKRVLEQASGRKVLMDTRQDPALIGGVVTKIGDVVYDGSLRSQLAAMRETILRD